MAYAFDQTMQALGQGGQSQQANIFQQPQQAGQQPQQQAGGTDAPTVASTGGDMSGAVGTSGGQAQPSTGSAYTQNARATGARNSLMSQNAGRVQSPVDVGGLTSSIGQAKQSLQNEANAYVSNAANMYGGGQVDQATQGQVQDFIKTGQAPTPTYQNTVPTAYSDQTAQAAATPSWFQLFTQGSPDAVKNIDPQTNTNFSRVGDLANTGTLRDLFQKTNDPEYSRGAAALDTALLTKNAGFNQQRDAALRANQDLLNTKNDITANAQGQAQKARNAAADLWKAGVSGQLQGGLSGYQSDAEKARDTFNNQLQGAESLDNKKDALRAVYADLASQNKELAPFITNDPGEYNHFNMMSADTDWRDFINNNQAQNYNTIQSLLGQGGSALTGGGRYAGVTPSAEMALGLDKNAVMQGALSKAQKAYRADQDQKTAAAAAVAKAKAEEDAKAKAAAAAEAAKTKTPSGGGSGNSFGKDVVKAGDAVNQTERQVEHYTGLSPNTLPSVPAHLPSVPKVTIPQTPKRPKLRR